MSDITQTTSRRLIVPALKGIYASAHDGVETVLRVVAGLALVTHGLGKIGDPFGAAGMVESLGFYPGVFWSPLLSFTEFFGGILIAVGFLTRPASMDQGYGGAEKSILWAAIFLFFVIRGGNRHSVDARIGREF